MTLSAHDWVHAAAVDPAVFARWPDYAVILVASDDVAPDTLRSVADEFVDQAEAHARNRAVDDVDDHVAQWHAAYREFGVKPRVARVSVDALVRRAVTDDGLPRVGVLVDLYNAVSVLQCVPIGGEDLDRYSGPPRLSIATGAEVFLTTAHGESVVDHPAPGEPIWVDDVGVTCRRWNWRQTSRTAIHDDTCRVGFIVDSLSAPDHEAAHRAADQLAGPPGWDDAHAGDHGRLNGSFAPGRGVAWWCSV